MGSIFDLGMLLVEEFELFDPGIKSGSLFIWMFCWPSILNEIFLFSSPVSSQKLLHQSKTAVCLKFCLRTENGNPDSGNRFDENYGLASTQSLKNKDIPEGGAKGTILHSCVCSFSRPSSRWSWRICRLGAQPRLCFEKYVDVRHFSFLLIMSLH